MVKLFGIDTWDAGVPADALAVAQDAGWTADEFARWWRDKYDLT
jgi:hypothetical protein